MSTLDKLKEILNKVEPDVDTSNLTEKSKIVADLGLSSLSIIQFVIMIEDEFNMKFDVEMELDTVEDLINYIDKNKK